MPVEFYIGHMRSKHVPLVALALIGPLTAPAQDRKQIPLPPAQGILPDVLGVFKSLQEFLEAQKLTLGDVVMIHAYRWFCPLLGAAHC